MTQLSMYAAITPLIHHSTRANVVSHNRTSYQHTIREWVALTYLSSYQLKCQCIQCTVYVYNAYSTHLALHKSNRRVPQPHHKTTYNKGITDVDLLDFLSVSYRPSIRGKSGNSHY